MDVQEALEELLSPVQNFNGKEAYAALEFLKKVLSDQDERRFAEVGKVVVEQLLFSGHHYCDSGSNAGQFRFSQSLYLSREHERFIAKVRRRTFKDVPEDGSETA